MGNEPTIEFKVAKYYTPKEVHGNFVDTYKSRNKSYRIFREPEDDGTRYYFYSTLAGLYWLGKKIIPRFVELDGCINCDAYQRQKRGEGQLHDNMASCVNLDCKENGHDILHPYSGNHELINYWREHLVKVLSKRGAEITEDISKAQNLKRS